LARLKWSSLCTFRLLVIPQPEADRDAPLNLHLNIGSLLFEDIDQIDLTGPF